MRVTGVICECNPLHNGHALFFKQAKQKSNADYLIAVMSGDFTQRGEPAMMPKHLRTKAALLNGADLVLELLPPFATASAERFAEGGVSVLSATNVVDTLAFGVEPSLFLSHAPSGASPGPPVSPLSAPVGASAEGIGRCRRLLSEIAAVLNEEPPAYKKELRRCLAMGFSFPKAREAALKPLLSSRETTAFLQNPNALLGIEYAKAVQKLHAAIRLLPLPRAGAPHNATLPPENSENKEAFSFSGATALRGLVKTAYPCEPKPPYHTERDAKKPLSTDVKTAHPLPAAFLSALPENTHGFLDAAYGTDWPLFSADFNLLLFEKLLFATRESLSSVADMSPELAGRILRLKKDFTDIDAFAAAVKNKAYTQSRIRRALIHLLLDIRKDALPADTKKTPLPAALFVLGFQKKAAPLLRAIAKASSAAIICRKADLARYEAAVNACSNTSAKKGPPPEAMEALLRPSLLYELVAAQKFSRPFVHPFSRPPVLTAAQVPVQVLP